MTRASNIIDEGVRAAPPTAPARQRIAAAIGVLVPFLGLILALIGLWGWGVTGTDLMLLGVMYVTTGLGVTIGYHRLFTHRSFEAARPVEFLLAVLGSMAVQGTLIRWVAVHRRHHQHSDRTEDPHSPHHHGGGVRGVIAGFWHAHLGWIFKNDPPNLERYVRDLNADRMLRTTSRLFGVWVLLGLLFPAALGGLLSGTWTGALTGLLWGGLVRIFLGHHITWSINSVCHLWGSRPFDRDDRSRNNFVFGILGLGEGWHNNHHAFPTSARHGLRWWQLDLSYLTIRALGSMGLVRCVRVPDGRKFSAGRTDSVDPGDHEEA
jgi:stearoyl-CoA desaturase (delta-9 desaturase)